MISLTVLALAGALVIQDTPARASSPPADLDQAVEIEAITVEGRRTRDAAQAFVRSVAAAPAGARLARWKAPICISVANMRAPYGQMMIDRIADVATELDLEVGQPGCTANVLILATEDGPSTAKALVEGWRGRFRPPVDNSNMGLAALDRFRTSQAPVRWWQISMPFSLDTNSLAAPVAGGPPPNVSVRNLSRMRSGIRHDLTSVTVVIDLSKTEGVALPALIDYTAMVVLAQVDPRADYSGQPTVLNLFSDREAVEGLTDWDRDYLDALYSAEPDRASAVGQEAAVADSLMRKRRERADAPIPNLDNQ